MKIEVDQEGLDNISKLTDICLKAHGTNALGVVTKVLGAIIITPIVGKKNQTPKKSKK